MTLDYIPARTGRLTKSGRPFKGHHKPFDAFYEPEPNTGCWLWIGATRPFGYGIYQEYPNGKRHTVSAHRYSWTIHRGPIPDGLCVLHRCDVPQCVNPDHLFLGTLKDNSQDACRKRRMNAPGVAKGWPLRNAAKSECKRGHPFTPENTLINRRKNGKLRRNCRACRRILEQNYRDRQRATA